MFHDSELEAFRGYADALPGNCHVPGRHLRHARGRRPRDRRSARELRARGHELAGIRLDSGDLAHLSCEARRMLDEAGFPAARIVASNDLDEHLIGSIIEQGARIDVWGVGTKLVTAYDQPALGGVYKLGASRDDARRVARCDQAVASSRSRSRIPASSRCAGCAAATSYVGDVIYDCRAWRDARRARCTTSRTRRVTMAAPAADAERRSARHRDRSRPPRRSTRRRSTMPGARAAADLARLSPRTRRFLNPQPYPVGLDRAVHARKQELIAAARGASERGSMTEPLVFSTEPYEYLGTAIAAAGGWELGRSHRETLSRRRALPAGSRPIRLIATCSWSAARSTTRRPSSSTISPAGWSVDGRVPAVAW